MQQHRLSDGWRDAEAAAYEHLRRNPALDEHGPHLVDEATLIVDTDGTTVLGAYMPIPHDAAALVREFRPLCATLPLASGDGAYRTDGMQAKATMIGYRPRLPLQRMEFCGPCATNRKYPHAVDLLARIAEALLPTYQQIAPDVYLAHVQAARDIGPEWHYAGPYTAGIFNRDKPLAYHRDTGNLRGSWNLQIVMREHTEGGHLVVPGWGVAFACTDASLVMFDAGSTTHGVSPIVRRRRTGWRCSVVYYSITQMRNCLPPDEEKALARVRRTEREGRRARGLMPDDPT